MIHAHCNSSMTLAARLRCGLFVLAIALGVFAFRLHALADLEPRIDQAGFSHWVRDLVDADHFVPDPRARGTWIGALEADRESFVHQIAIRIYNVHHLAFNLIPLAIDVGISSVSGDDYRTQVAISLLGSVCVLLALGSFPFWLAPGSARHSPDRGDGGRAVLGQDAWIGLASALTAGSALYLHHYAAFGVHNFGIAALIAATGATSRLLTSRAGMGFAVAAASAVLAIYTHWTNLLLLPPATVLALAATAEWDLSKRARVAVRYAAIVGAWVAPVVFLAVALDTGRSDLVYVTSDDPAATGLFAILARAAGWFGAGATLFSWPGLVLGLVGIAAAYRVQRLRLPAMILLIHFLLWSVFPGIADKWLRTYLYAVPLLALGVGNALVLAFQVAAPDRAGLHGRGSVPGARFLMPGAAVLLASWHLAVQIPGLVSDARARARLPEFWDDYRRGQGTLTPMIAEIEAAVPKGSVLLTWGYPLQDLLASLGDSPLSVEVPPALDSMWMRYREGGLEDYVRRRSVTLRRDAPLFLVVGGGVSHAELEVALGGVLGDGFELAPAFRIDPLRSWDTDVGVYGRVSLYRVWAELPQTAGDPGPFSRRPLG